MDARAQPQPQPRRNWLVAVAGSSATDVWAAGYDLDTAGQHRTLLMHWDGRRWAIVPSPNVDKDNLLNGLAVLSPTDAWALGSALDESFAGRTLIQHWDGASWAVVQAPTPASAVLAATCWTSRPPPPPSCGRSVTTARTTG